MAVRFAYDIITKDKSSIWIEDLCETYGCMSVTNAAEDVIIDLVSKGHVTKETRVFYTDTMGQIDELLHDGTEFTGFKPGPLNEGK